MEYDQFTTKHYKMNEQMGNWLNAYGVFCTAMCLPNRNETELDILWETACAVYQDFLESECNNPNQSELDCIQNFVNQQNTNL